MDVRRQPLDVRAGERTIQPSRRGAIRWFAAVTVTTLFALSVVASVLNGFVVTLTVIAGLGWLGYRLAKLVEFLIGAATTHRHDL